MSGSLMTKQEAAALATLLNGAGCIPFGDPLAGEGAFHVPSLGLIAPGEACVVWTSDNPEDPLDFVLGRWTVEDDPG